MLSIRVKKCFDLEVWNHFMVFKDVFFKLQISPLWAELCLSTILTFLWCYHFSGHKSMCLVWSSAWKYQFIFFTTFCVQGQVEKICQPWLEVSIGQIGHINARSNNQDKTDRDNLLPNPFGYKMKSFFQLKSLWQMSIQNEIHSIVK